jgi:hypothetical protein
MPPGLDAGGWATARAGPVHSSHASPLALSSASGHASLPLHALPERNLIGVAGELRTLIKVRISPGLAAASKTRQIDDASVCCASRHTCLGEDSPSQDMVPPACPDASSSMRGNGQGTHSSWSLAPRTSVTVVHSKTWEQSQRLAMFMKFETPSLAAVGKTSARSATVPPAAVSKARTIGPPLPRLPSDSRPWRWLLAVSLSSTSDPVVIKQGVRNSA